MKNTEVHIMDELNIGDKLLTYNKSKIDLSKRPVGVVKIYEKNGNDKLKLIHKHNLIVYTGREWVASRLFNKTNVSIDQTKDEYIGWAGLGSGGASVDPLIPDNPTNSDDDLITPIPLSLTDSSYCDEDVVGGTGYYKKPIDTSDVVFEIDTANDDKYLVVKVSFAITADDANGYTLSEAGLFTSESSNDLTDYHIFARVTFPAIVKTSGRDLLFVWYIYV